MNFLFFIILLGLSSSLYSYPIFFECNKDHISDIETPRQLVDLLKKFSNLNSKKKKEIYAAVCSGQQECLKDFKNIVKLASLNEAAAQKVLEDELEKLELNGISKISDKLASLARNNNKEYNLLKVITACRNAMKNLEASEFIIPGGSHITTIYPYYSNYMYAGGCRKLDGHGCDPIPKKDIDDIVNQSVAFGVDPYLAIAIGLMEGGTSGIGDLYLDPVGKMDIIGCKGKSIANASKNPKALNSYGTKYIFKKGVVNNKNIASSMASYIETNRKIDRSKKSYFCRNTISAITKVRSSYKNSNGECCLKLPFVAKKSDIKNIERALTIKNIAKITKRKFRKKEEPAFRVQRFNGYTNLMGAAESVPVFRSGANYYKDPAYGYQSLDYVLNTLMTNPYIQEQVEKSKKEMKKDFKSILCIDKKRGSYVIDSDFYFDKHKNTARLGIIKEKFDKGVRFEKLTKRERKIFLKELTYKNVAPLLLNGELGGLSDIGQRELMSKHYSNIAKYMPNAEIGYDSISQDITLEEFIIRFDNALVGTVDADKFTEEEKENIFDLTLDSKQVNKLYNMNNVLAVQFKDKIPGLDKFYMSYLNGYETLRDIKSFSEYKKNFFQISGINSKDITDQVSLDQFLKEKYKLEMDNFEVKKLAEMASIELDEMLLPGVYVHTSKIIKDPVKILEKFNIPKTKNNIQEVEEILGYLLGTLEMEDLLAEVTKKTDYNKVMKEYFTKVYSLRDTIGKASTYPFRKFTDSEIDKLANKMSANNSNFE